MAEQIAYEAAQVVDAIVRDIKQEFVVPEDRFDSLKLSTLPKVYAQINSFVADACDHVFNENRKQILLTAISKNIERQRREKRFQILNSENIEEFIETYLQDMDSLLLGEEKDLLREKKLQLSQLKARVKELQTKSKKYTALIERKNEIESFDPDDFNIPAITHPLGNSREITEKFLSTLSQE